MRATTLVGLFIGGAVAVAGGLALAAPRQRPPFFEYLTQEGDTLSALALRFFGDGQQWPALVEANQDRLPEKTDKVLVGIKLRMPCLWVTVKKGDTLGKIAAEALGDDDRWRRIWEANRKLLPDPDKLEIGRELAVPLLGKSKPAPEIAAVGVSGLDCFGVDDFTSVGVS